LFYNAFKDLNSERTDGAIPWSAVQNYCKELELDNTQTEAMHHHIVAMDATQDKFYTAKSKKKV